MEGQGPPHNIPAPGRVGLGPPSPLLEKYHPQIRSILNLLVFPGLEIYIRGSDKQLMCPIQDRPWSSVGDRIGLLARPIAFAPFTKGTGGTS